MRFTSDEQRKAMFARLKGGASGSGHGGRKGSFTINWVFGASGIDTAQNTNHKNSISNRHIPGFMVITPFGEGTTSGGRRTSLGLAGGYQLEIPYGNWVDYDKRHGIASPSDWANTAWTDIFGKSLTTPKGATVWSGTFWSDINPGLTTAETSEQYYEAAAKNAGIENPPPYDGLARDAYYAFGGSANQGQGKKTSGYGKPDKKTLQDIFPWITSD